MPGDTKIKRTANGWIDVDEPSKTFSVRREARAFRRYRTTGISPNGRSVWASKTSLTPDHTPHVPQNGLTSLQQRLYNRLTRQQGVGLQDALEVIKNNGYNKAASYGHMREAGATHAEALMVIDLGLPGVSLIYGQHRAVGYDHADALGDALVIDGLNTDGDD